MVSSLPVWCRAARRPVPRSSGAFPASPPTRRWPPLPPANGPARDSMPSPSPPRRTPGATSSSRRSRSVSTSWPTSRSPRTPPAPGSSTPPPGLAGLVLSVYHNRRWDSDIVTLRALLDSRRLGTVSRFHSRMDQGDGSTMEGGPSGGLLRDLGSHVIDQALWLFGPAAARVRDAGVDRYPAGTDRLLVRDQSSPTAAGLSSHAVGLQTQLPPTERELRVYGSLGSYLARSVDVQARDAISGLRPVDDREQGGVASQKSAWGSLNTAAGLGRGAGRAGRLHRLLRAFRRSRPQRLVRHR